jgi:subtilisin family serine protease
MRALLLALTLLVSLAPAAARATTPAPPLPAGAVVVAELAPGARVPSAAALGVDAVTSDGGELRITPDGAESGAALVRRLAARPDIATAAIDAPATAAACALTDTTCDFYANGYQWALGDGTGGADAAAAWATTTGAGVVVAVIDTGIRPNPDLPVPVDGWDFVDGDADPTDPGDACGGNISTWHGSHVAGTIAGLDNDAGVVGVAPGVDLLAVRVLGPCSGSFVGVANAIRWSAGLATDVAGDLWAASGVAPNAHPADVINLSLGGMALCTDFLVSVNGGPNTPYLAEATTAAAAAGAVIVAAAGNSTANASGYAPANCPGVISVAATGPGGERASYSNYGVAVDIAAPGGNYRDCNGSGSTTAADAACSMIVSATDTGTAGPVADALGYKQGTSMAAPHVAGAAALVVAAAPWLTPSQVETLLQGSGRAFPAVASGLTACTVATCGDGLLDITAAVAAALLTDGTAPVDGSLALVAGDGQIEASWSDFSDDTGITAYRLVSGASAGLSCAATRDYEGSDTSYTLTAANGTRRYVRVCAIDDAGNLSAGIEASAVPAPPRDSTAPAAAVIVLDGGATYTTSRSVTISYSATDASPVSVACANETGNLCWATIAETGTATYTLSAGEGTKTVYAWLIDSEGNVTTAPAADSIVYDATAPAGGTLAATMPVGGSTTLSWAGVSDAVSGIVSYQLVMAPDDAPADCASGTPVYTGSGTTATATGLLAGRYYGFRLCATDAAGNRSAGVTVETQTIPGAPTGLVAVPGSLRATLVWATPADTGNTPITDYLVQYRLTGSSTWRTFADGTSTAAGAVVSGLTNGSTYAFRVCARNAVGLGACSSEASIIVGTPTAARSVTATRVSATSVRVSWAAPVTSNGSAITVYRIAYRRVYANGTYGTWLFRYDTTPASRVQTISSLAVGGVYQFKVDARNGRGYGPYSTVVGYTSR